MKQGKILLFFIFLFFGVSIQSALAYTLNPNSGNLQIGTNQSIQVVASGVPTGANTANIVINLTGPCTFISFTAASGLLETGTFTSTQIDKGVGVSGGGTLSNGQVLATFSVNCTSAGTLTLSAGTDAGYVIPDTPPTLVQISGNLATFSVSTSTPNTSINLMDLSFVLGGVLVVFGIALFVQSKIQKKDF